ncbi:MAG: pilus assembly protein TadG-related protein, partial [Planctomycetota bacterium]|nr:pilus assembly protein TadG-related protein [Planctomycetota bacterium]
QSLVGKKRPSCRVIREFTSTSFNCPGGTHTETFRSGRLRHRGVVIVWVAIMLLVMILFVGLSLDTAKVALVLHQMQNASDAAALAGANFVRTDRLGARIQAKWIAEQNSAEGKPVKLDRNDDNLPNGDIVIGWYNRDEQTFTPAQSESDHVNAMAVSTVRSKARAALGGPVGLTFGPIAKVPTVNLTGRWWRKGRPYAIAMSSRGIGAGLIALKPWDTGLLMHGDVTLNVRPIPPARPDEGEVQINSESYDALDVDGASAQIESTAVNITGGADIGNYDMGVPYTTGASPIDDPLAWLDPPTWNPADDLTAETKLQVGDTSSDTRIKISTPKEPGIPHEIYPGYYSGGFYLNSTDSPGNPSVHFNPGIYIIGGSSKGKIAGLVTRGSAYGASTQAMFYITGDGIVDIRGNGGFAATEPTTGSLASGGFSTDYEGVTIFQDRANTNEAYITGTSDLDLDGTLYFPSADPVTIIGGGWGFGNQLIGYRFEIGGSGVVGIDYDGRNRRPQKTAFLVE